MSEPSIKRGNGTLPATACVEDGSWVRRVWTDHTPALVLGLLLCSFVFLQSLLPLRTTVQIGADEGFELAKATLCLRGHHLYSEVWNDQPPLHTFLVTQILKHISPSILGPRLLTVCFSLLLLAAIFVISFRVNGLW